jgi:hypothetical protein
VLVRRNRRERAVTLLQPIADKLNRLDVVLAPNRRRRAEEKEAHRHRFAGRCASGELVENLEVALRVRVLADCAFELRRVDLHVGAGELAHLLQLLRRPRRLRRPAAADDDDLLQRGLGDRLDRGIRRVRRRELVRRQREHARDVERDVAVADHNGPLGVQVELELLEVGMAVVPGDELGGRPRPGQVLAGNPEPAVGLRADGVDHGVVERVRSACVRSRPTSTLPMNR